jgi:hypothetical protein
MQGEGPLPDPLHPAEPLPKRGALAHVSPGTGSSLLPKADRCAFENLVVLSFNYIKKYLFSLQSNINE